MADLLASSYNKLTKVNKGEQVSGKIVGITDKEVVVDLGAKSEGIINKQDFNKDQQQSLSIGDSVEAYVVTVENESGQTHLSLFKQIAIAYAHKGGKFHQENLKKWQKLSQILKGKGEVKGRVIEANKGGLLVEVDGIRGFLPVSQISFTSLEKAGKGNSSADPLGNLSALAGEELTLHVLEIDPDNNRLILSERGVVSAELSESLRSFKVGSKVAAQVLAVTPLGVFVTVNGTEGLIYSNEVSWEKTENLKTQFTVGQEVEGAVVGIDENFGRLQISLRQLEEDPFTEIAAKIMVDDVVKGTVLEVGQMGVKVSLSDNVEGFIPIAKIERGNEYTVGQETTFLVDEIDKSHRRVNLAPFLTTTKGLIYK